MTFSLSTFQTHGKSTAISIHAKNLPVNSKSSTNVDIIYTVNYSNPLLRLLTKMRTGAAQQWKEFVSGCLVPGLAAARQ